VLGRRASSKCRKLQRCLCNRWENEGDAPLKFEIIFLVFDHQVKEKNDLACPIHNLKDLTLMLSLSFLRKGVSLGYVGRIKT